MSNITSDRLRQFRERADTESSLRHGDPYYEDGGEASSFELAVTPAAVHELVDEIEKLRKALAGHLFDGESLSIRESVRSQFILESARSAAAQRAEGVRMAARKYPAVLWDMVSSGSVIGYLTQFADELEEDQ